MGLNDLTSRAAVEQAIDEFDELGRQGFLAKYGFGSARDYFVWHRGRAYDSKAIVGAAYGFQFPRAGPLPASRFSGGERTVQAVLERLGLTVRRASELPTRPLYTSQFLLRGQTYSRADLREKFAVTDATINNGVFRHKPHRSVWLFVTEDKTPDRTQYADRLRGDVLQWDGQRSGRTDDLIVNHRENDLELLVFYRREKYEFAGAAFRYEGRFEYLTHEGVAPAHFTLRRLRDPLEDVADAEDAAGAFSPSNVEDARRRTLTAIAQRQGQQAFRAALMEAYEGRCAFTGCTVSRVLEAAHIYPFKGPQTNRVSNGLLLRADIHTLFDLGLLAVDPETYRIRVSEKLHGSEYESLHGRRLLLPPAPDRPSREALQWHQSECCDVAPEA